VPPELRALLRVNGAGSGGSGIDAEDADGEARYLRDLEALGGVELFDVDGIERAPELVGRTLASFDMLARAAPTTRPDSAVQGLVESPEWIVIGDHGGGSGELVAIDMAPGPAGHVGQLVVLSHESNVGAWLLADSITDLVLNGPNESPTDHDPYGEARSSVIVNSAEGMTVQAAATDELEVLVVGSWDDAPSDLAPLVGLPRLRTLIAEPGKIADPLVIGKLDHLEYLEIGLADWQALLDADAVPGSLLAAGISGRVGDPAAVDAVYDQLIQRWGGEPLRTVTIRGSLA
jgi:hypothetical protein